jgi:hypothetical protein
VSSTGSCCRRRRRRHCIGITTYRHRPGISLRPRCGPISQCRREVLRKARPSLAISDASSCVLDLAQTRCSRGLWRPRVLRSKAPQRLPRSPTSRRSPEASGVTDPADVKRQMRPEPPQNLTMRSGAATGADSSSSPTDMDSAPTYNMKQMEIPHSKRREWRCEGFEYHSRPFNLVSRYGVKPGLTLLPTASAWSARAHASLFFCSIVEEPFASVNRVDWNRPQPGAPSASPTADPVPSRMAAEKREGFGARVIASSSDTRRCAVGLHPRRVWGHTPNSGAVTFPGSLHRRYPGSTSDLRRRIGCSWRVVATCMYERVQRTCATGARPWGAYSKF